MGSAFTSTIEYTAVPVEAQYIEKEETLEERANRIAEEFKIDKQAFFNLIESESSWDTKARGKAGEIGLVQIMPHWGFTTEQMEDPEFSMRFAAQKFKEGKQYLWTPCSCISFARAMGIKLPYPMNADDLFPNTDVPIVGGVLILKYPNGEHHVIPILKDTIQRDGYHTVSANKEPCKITSEIIPLDSKLIMGFYRYAQADI